MHRISKARCLGICSLQIVRQGDPSIANASRFHGGSGVAGLIPRLSQCVRHRSKRRKRTPHSQVRVALQEGGYSSRSIIPINHLPATCSQATTPPPPSGECNKCSGTQCVQPSRGILHDGTDARRTDQVGSCIGVECSVCRQRLAACMKIGVAALVICHLEAEGKRNREAFTPVRR